MVELVVTSVVTVAPKVLEKPVKGSAVPCWEAVLKTVADCPNAVLITVSWYGITVGAAEVNILVVMKSVVIMITLVSNLAFNSE